jgi:AGCS family alanine or glycine:cation symporter
MDTFSNAFASIVNALTFFVWELSVPFGDSLEIPWLVVLLLGTGIFLTLRMAFIQFRRLGHAVAIVSGKYDKPGDVGDISHFQALTTALSATVGIGNIAGVAMAIHYGGPGAVFWMWCTALLGMCTKYTEVSLAMKYRDFDDEGNTSGGPHKYIEKGLGRRWKPVALFFAGCAILCSLGAGNMNQINTLAGAVHDNVQIPDLYTGIACAVLVGAVILGGIQRIGRVTSILAPAMAIIYVLGALAVLFINFGQIPNAFASIFREAFNPTAGFAGTAAGVFSTSLLWGVKRGLFSNEAGQGSAPIAHAAAKGEYPLQEGLVALLEPFIDTIIICSMTALVILTSGLWNTPIEEGHQLSHKDVQVMTWNPEVLPTLESFGTAQGRRGSAATNELAGIEAKAGSSETQAVQEVLVIQDGRPTQIRHSDGSTTGAILVKNRAPIFFNREGLGIFDTTGTTPFTGEVPVLNGSIVTKDGEAGHKAQLKGDTIRVGQALTAAAFTQSLGGFGGFIVVLTVILFALSTAISWSYYGDRCTQYIFGTRGVLVYRLLFLGFVVLGAVLPLQTVWDFGDAALGLMTVPNLIAILFLSGEVRRMQREYFAHPPRRP